MAHWVAAMNGCHQDAGHQDQQQTLYLLQDQFWWPSMATQMQNSDKQLQIMHQTQRHLSESQSAQPIIATAPLELLHMDFTSIEMTMELDQPPNVVSMFGLLWSLYMKHVMAYMTPYQTVNRLLLSFCGKDTSQSLEHWPSSWVIEAPISKVASCQRSVWACMGIWKVRISTYHAQTNGQVEQAHQMLMHMIGKLSRDQKEDWPKDLPELVHAYKLHKIGYHWI